MLERGAYRVSAYRSRVDKDYSALCNVWPCTCHAIVQVSHARHVPKQLRKIGWHTHIGKWVCPEHAAKTLLQPDGSIAEREK